MAMANGAAALCSIFTIFFGGSPLVYSPSPRGQCDNCCPIREIKDIKFLLYTRANPDFGSRLYIQDTERFAKSNFNKSNPTVFYLHGFSEKAPGGKGSSAQEIRDAFLDVDDYNVILVDWSPLTAMPWYANSVQNGPKVGRYMARFLHFLLKNGVELDSIHVIGFSLGAEVAGFIGKTLKEWGFLLPRITGLDPALPLYDFEVKSQRLSPSDARFVDVIHTDGGVLGQPWPIGHADFYPNGGTPLQPGCVEEEIQKQRFLNIFVGCSHQRAWQYFAESVRRPRAFLVDNCEPRTKPSSRFARSDHDGSNEFKQCDGEVSAFMGLRADPRLRGNFFVKTNEKPQFGRNLD